MNITPRFLTVIALAAAISSAQQVAGSDATSTANSPEALAGTAEQNVQPVADSTKSTLEEVAAQGSDSTSLVADTSKAVAEVQTSTSDSVVAVPVAESSQNGFVEVKQQANDSLVAKPADTAAVKPVAPVAATTVEPAKEALAENNSKKVPAKTIEKEEPVKSKGKEGKISYQEYQDRISQKADSVLSHNFHHGISIAGARYQDKTYGKIIRGGDWGTGFGLYYSYRNYFVKALGIQTRAGFIYRYGNFKNDEIVEEGSFKTGESYALNKHFNLVYENISFDLPITAKVGGFVEPTTFIYLGFTFGVTKPLCERVTTTSTYDFAKKSKNIETLDKEGKNVFPLTEFREKSKPFFMDDWETNGWVGLGVDGKYVSFAAQVLVASGSSTYDNHRYYPIWHGSEPTIRLLVDFSLR